MESRTGFLASNREREEREREYVCSLTHMLKFGFMDTEEEHNEDRQENPTKNSGKHLSFFLSLILLVLYGL